MKLKYTWPLFILALAGGYWAYQSQKSPITKAPASPENLPTEVDVQVIEYKPVAISSELTATLKGSSQVEIYPRFPGRLNQALVYEGQRVTKGQALFTIDRADNDGGTLAYTMRSPIDGWVIEFPNPSHGYELKTEKKLLSIAEDRELRAVLQLGQRYWKFINKGLPLTVRVGEDIRPARLLSYNQGSTDRFASIKLTVAVDNKDRSWRAGQDAFFNLSLDERERILIPTAAVRFSDEGSLVYLVNESSKVEKRNIQSQAFNADYSEVNAGLAQGDKLIVSRINRLSPGDKVRIFEEAKNTVEQSPAPTIQAGGQKG